jgi:predicted ArsR family transcriptional regulator
MSLHCTDNKKVEGMTIREIAEKLSIEPNTVKQRLFKAGIKPLTKEAIYASDVWERIRDVPGKGRPRKPTLDQ